MIIKFAKCTFQIRLIKQVSCDQITVITITVNDLTVIKNILYGNLLHLENILMFLKGKLHFNVIIIKCQLFLCHGRKYCGNRLPIAFLLMYDLFKGCICPDDLAGIIHQYMRKLQIPEQLSLNLTILCRKADKLIHDNRLISIKQ